MFKKNKETKNTSRLKAYSYYGSGTRKDHTTSVDRHGKQVIARITRTHLSFTKICIVLLGLIAFGFISSVESTPIIRFSSSGVNPRDTEDYRKGATEIIKSTVFNKSKLTFDYKKAEEDIKKKYPEVESVSITFDLVGRKPVFQMQIHSPAYLYEVLGVRWVIDNRGIAIGRQEDLKESFTESLKTIIDESRDNNIKIGETLLAPSIVTYISTLENVLSKQLTVVESIYIPITPKEVDLVIRGENWRYKLNSEGEVTIQAGTLLAARATFNADGVVPIDYVDLRVPEKVFWK